MKGVRLNEFARDVCHFGLPVSFRWNASSPHDDCCVDVIVPSLRHQLLGHVARGPASVLLTVLLRGPYRISG